MTREQGPQIIALYTKGAGEREIAERSGVDIKDVRQFLIAHGKTLRETANKTWKEMSQKEKLEIINEYEQDQHTTTCSLALKYKASQNTIYTFLKAHGVKFRKRAANTAEPPKSEPAKESKKEELAPADTGTSLAVNTIPDGEKASDKNTISIYEYNTLKAECQALTKALKFVHKGILAQYEYMSHECQQAFDLGQLFAEIEQRMKEGGIEIDV